MEGNGHGCFEKRKLKFSEKVSFLEDEDVSDEYGAAGIPKVAEKEDEQKWTTKDKEEFYQLGDIQNLRTKHVEQDQGTDKHFIGVSTPISHTSKTKLIRFLEKMPTSGTHGCITSSELCKPVNGKYAEGVQFKKKQDYSASSKRRVSKCSDLTTNRDFIRKEILRSEWNKNEAVITIQMEHQHIAVVIGVIQRSAMWIELLLKDAGISLEDFLRSKFPLQMKVLLDICDQGLRALRHIHLHGIRHHDVKPANFTVDERLNVRLIDFGSSRHSFEQVSMMGGWTTEYLPPECCRYLLAKEQRSKPGLSSQITTKVDVFAFAMVIGYLVTGKHLLIGLVTPNCKYQTGQREGLRGNLMKKIIENTEEIQDLFSKTINNESLRVLLQTMSHEDVEIRDSAKDALVKVTEMRQIDQPTNPKKTDKVMVEELDMNDVYSTTKLKRRGPALQHPCIRTQESVHENDASRNAYMFQMSQQHQLDVQTSKQIDELKQAEALLSEGSTVIPPKYRKANKPASGIDTPLVQASYAPCMAEHDVSERQENDEQLKINHDEVPLKQKTAIATRQQQKKEPTPSCFGRRLPSDLDLIQTVDLIHGYDSSKFRTAECEMDKTGGGFGNGNCNNWRMNKETGTEILPRLDLLLSSDSFKE